jgi:phenylalanine-4-hydroxylase
MATATKHAARGLTTTRAAFIEEAKSRGELFIHQPYEQYSHENQETWRRLYAAIAPKWRTYAHPRFMQGVDALALNPDRIPRLEEINRFLEPLSAFKAKAVSGYVPTFLFFDSLSRREFPTTITIRDGSRLDYLPEPDIFHDLAGHVPMHTDRRFADALVRFGEVARTAALEVRKVEDPDRRLHAVESVIKALARFFWFTVEFGLMQRPDTASHTPSHTPSHEVELCVCGSGLLSSAGEIEHAIESPEVQRYPFQLEWVVNQYFEIDHYQPLLFYTRSFEDLFDRVDELERWVRAGRLYNVSPGEPEINERDLASFLEAAT